MYADHLPASKQQILEIAGGRFSFVESNNGRKDYIETLNRWGEGNRSLLSPAKLPRSLAAVARLVPRYLKDRDFRLQIESLWRNDQQVCFLEEIMSHERMFFRKT